MRTDLGVAFGQVVVELRGARGWNQEQLAERANRSRNLVSRFERGVSVPTLESIWDLAHAFGIKPETLIQRTHAQLDHDRRARRKPAPRQVGRPRKPR